MSPFTAANLPEALRSWAVARPEQRLVFPELGTELRIDRLQEAASRFAGTLARAGVGRGDVVGLLSATGPQVLLGVFGVTATGAAVSVLPIPPLMSSPEATVRKLVGFLDAADMRYLLTDPAQRPLADLVCTTRPETTVLELPAVDAVDGPVFDASAVRGDDIAIIQYTSGSTSQPKGVVLRHSTVLAGIRSIGVSAQITPDDVFVQWVPHFHDMGLFGWLAYLLHGAATHTFSPGAFIRRPAAFLSYLAEHRGTVTCGPDFGYDLLLAAVDDVAAARLDLSAWRLAFNGSEPVSAATVERFTRRFAAAGVRPSTMFPVYGMAEATLAITFPEVGAISPVLHVDRSRLTNAGEVRLVAASDPDAKAVVAVGQPIDGMELRLVDAAGTPVGDSELAEIEIRGAAVTDGYYRNPEATAALWHGDWRRTGDLGFRHGGQLYVAGRIKDMVIVNGANFFAQDVEAVVRDVPGVYRGRCVAVPDDAEHLTVVAETKSPHEPLADEVRRRVSAELGLSAVRVHLVRPGALPRTTSGKYQRAKARELIGAGT